MEVTEIISYFVNIDTNMIEISFRINDDTDDFFRIACFDFKTAEEYGLNFDHEDYDYYSEDFEDMDFEEDEEIKIDKSELISFLNEFYEINPEQLPESEPY